MVQRITVPAMPEDEVDTYADAVVAEPRLRPGTMHHLDPRTLIPDAANVRDDVGDVDSLADSIRENGVLTPVAITPSRLLVYGHRRLAAALAVLDDPDVDEDEKAKARTIPCVVRPELDAGERVIEQVVENVQREGLGPIEEAVAYNRLADLGLGQVTIARRVGRSEGHVSRRLAILALPARTRQRVTDGELPASAAYALTRLLHHPLMQNREDRGARIDAVAAKASTEAKAEQAVAAELRALSTLREAGLVPARSIVAESEAERKAALRVAAERRDAWFAENLRSRNPAGNPAIHRFHVQAAVLELAPAAAARRACRWLGQDTTGFDPRVALSAYASVSGDTLAAAALAVSLAMCEATAASDAPWGEQHERWAEYLDTGGYEPDATEAEWRAARKPFGTPIAALAAPKEDAG